MLWKILRSLQENNRVGAADFSVEPSKRLIVQIVCANLVDFRSLPNFFLSYAGTFYTFTSAEATCHNMFTLTPPSLLWQFKRFWSYFKGRKCCRIKYFFSCFLLKDSSLDNPKHCNMSQSTEDFKRYEYTILFFDKKYNKTSFSRLRL